MHQKYEVVPGGVQRACMSEPEVWTSIPTEGWCIRPIHSVDVATATGIPGELDEKGDLGGK